MRIERNELTVAVIGCGPSGWAHLARWATLSGVRISAVCDPESDRLLRAADRFQCAAFPDPAALLAGEPFDLVDICAPLHFRAATVEAGLRAGAGVLCEIPFSAEPEAARGLVALADQRERLLLPTLPYRFHPSLLFLRDLLDNDDLGRPTMFRCRLTETLEDGVQGFSDSLKTENPEYHPDQRNVRTPGYLNTSLHGIDLFRACCGEAAFVAGRTARFSPEVEAEDTAAFLLQTERGTLGVVEATANPIGAQRVVEIYGTAGAARMDLEAGTMRSITADQPVWQGRDEGGPDGLERLLSHVTDVLRGLEPPAISAEDGVRALELYLRASG